MTQVTFHELIVTENGNTVSVAGTFSPNNASPFVRAIIAQILQLRCEPMGSLQINITGNTVTGQNTCG